jgi:hypothetical protein
MKRIINLFAILGTVLMLGSCIEQDYALWDGNLVEFDAAVMNAPAAGLTYPIIERIPLDKFTVTTARPFINRANTQGTLRLTVNYVSPHRPNAQTVSVKVVPEGTTAVAGTHFTLNPTVTIPANSSFGYVEVQLLDGLAALGTGNVVVVLELEGNGEIQPSEKFKRLGVRLRP